MANASFRFEMAAYLSDEDSKAVSFFGVFDQGRRVTVITKNGIGYTYRLPDGSGIGRISFDNILNQSVGKYWVETLKKHELIDKDENAANWIITSDYWSDGKDRGSILNGVMSDALAEKAWAIGGDGLFAF
ncbi:MAG: hypothetical protein IE914_04305 [Thiotrichales bacterium]|nr:hypothetical protein [Thiotrichales bacterium]